MPSFPELTKSGTLSVLQPMVDVYKHPEANPLKHIPRTVMSKEHSKHVVIRPGRLLSWLKTTNRKNNIASNTEEKTETQKHCNSIFVRGFQKQGFFF